MGAKGLFNERPISLSVWCGLPMFPRLSLILVACATSARACDLSDANVCFVHQTGGTMWKATLEAVRSARGHYPASPYVLVSDGGPSLARIASAYNASFWRDDKITSPGAPVGGLYTPERVLRFLGRMKRAAEMCGRAEFVVLWDDDNVCHRRARACPEADGNGLISSGAGFSPGFRAHVVNATGAYRSSRVSWGLMGGALFRKEALLGLSFAEHDIVRWTELDAATTTGVDGVLTAALLAGGHSVAGWAEVGQGPGAGGAAFEHGAKRWYGAQLGADEAHFAPDANASCSMYELTRGRWIDAPDVPAGYGFCQLDKRQDCRAFREQPYLGRAWVPDNPLCPVARVRPREYLSCFRNKRVAFVGDSLARNMQQALQCALMESPEPAREFRDGYKLEYDSRYPTYGVDLLIRTGGHPSTSWRDYLSPENIAELAAFDVVVVSTGSHWRRAESGVRAGDQAGVVEAVRARVDALLQLPERVQLIWRGPDLNHWSGDASDKPWERPCGNSSSDAERDPLPAWIRYAAREATAGTRIQFMDVTQMTAPRPDAHPGSVSHVDGKGRFDCLHWCLPGVPDAWNDVLYTYLCQGRNR